jgi:SOS response regulatory protein OraA/RecX
VELDGSRWRTLPVDAVVRAGVTVGRELDRPTARALGRELRRAEALRTAGRALRARDLSVKTLDDRLARRSVAPAVRAEALETLGRAGLVDDGRFAARRAEALAGRGWGDAAIRADLEQQGIAADPVETALAALEPEPERAKRLVERRGRTAATARYLGARGFDADAVEAAVGGLVAGDPWQG